MVINNIQKNTEKTDVSKAPAGADKKDSEEKDRPLKEFRAGGIIVTVWENKTNDNKIYYTTTIKRTYTLDNGKTFKECNHFSVYDLPKLLLLVGEAYRYIILKE